MRLSPSDRFDTYVDRSGDCFIWTGATQPNGYGVFTVQRKRVYAHRYAYEREHGPIPARSQVQHTCDTRNCVRPEHLKLGTPAENSQDMRRRGRVQPLVERPSIYARRRVAAGLSLRQVQERTGLNRGLVSMVERGIMIPTSEQSRLLLDLYAQVEYESSSSGPSR